MATHFTMKYIEGHQTLANIYENNFNYCDTVWKIQPVWRARAKTVAAIFDDLSIFKAITVVIVCTI